MWYLDMTKITDINVRKAIGYAYPYEDVWKAGGEIVGLTRVPGTSILPPGTAGRVEYDVLGIGGKDTDPAKAKELLAGGQRRWATSSSSSTPPTTRCRSPARTSWSRVSRQAGFTATPIASTAEKIREARSDYDSPINVRSSGWCSDWPSGGSWFPAQWDGALVGLEGMPNPANFKEADADAKQKEILGMPADEVPAAWGEFDKFIMETYYPAVVTGYSGTAIIRGSKIGGMFNDTVRGMPTFDDMYITE